MQRMNICGISVPVFPPWREMTLHTLKAHVCMLISGSALGMHGGHVDEAFNIYQGRPLGRRFPDLGCTINFGFVEAPRQWSPRTFGDQPRQHLRRLKATPKKEKPAVP